MSPNPDDYGVPLDFEEEPAGRKANGSNREEPQKASPAAEWPTIRPEAFHGLAGEFTQIVAPSTEADPVALLMQLLVEFGNAAGHGPHSMIEDTRHAVNLFLVMVGATGEARKGTSLDRVTKAMSAVDSEWSNSHIESGMTSGEGVAYAVRDSDGKEDQGVRDKRLMVVETEFASVLKVIQREGNILSPMIRQAWDSGNLRTLNKKNPVRASGAHLSIIAHITPEELRRSLAETEMANGFGNRFLWACVKRSKYLPEGGNCDLMSFRSFMSSLGKSLVFAKKVGQMKRNPEARELWAHVYPALTTLPSGLLGALTSRSAPIVQRLSCLYALLDSSAEVRTEHLKAALAVWAYAASSVRYVFGDALGDRVADQLLEALANAGSAGLTRTEIRDLFGRNLSTARISLALEYLLRLGRIVRVTESTSGRPVESWFLKGVE